jgi:threonine dehydrogenase-like Zn-dependent dehydrogenase
LRALVLESPGQAEVRSVDTPPETGGVMLRVELVGLCGSDLNSFRGRNPLVSYPRILGHEVAATVISGAKNLAPGTRVTLSPYSSCGKCSACVTQRFNACQQNQTLGVQRDGALCEFLEVPEEKLFVAHLPLEHLCIVEPLTVGFHAVARGRITSKDTVAIIGCGGVGLGAVAASAFRGARTIAIDQDETKLEIARYAGAAETLHCGEEDLHAGLTRLTSGHGPNVIIEAVGLPQTFRAAVEEAAFAGRVVYIGYAKELVTYETRLFVQKELDILGSRNALPRDFQEVIALLNTNRFPAQRAISRIVSLDETPAILQEWSENPQRFTKIMVRVPQN